MSISDLIAVMKEGAVNQISKPQAIYDDPVNLFVAKFLGTPPINVFDGEVRGGKLCVGSDPVMDAGGVKDGEVTVGVRPEGFVPDPEGALLCGLERVEVMGRDTSIVFRHSAMSSVNGRAIVDAEEAAAVAGGEVRFRFKPTKTHLFDKATEKRIYRDDEIRRGIGR